MVAGWLYLIVSGACAAFGNSLEPITILVLFQTVFLIAGLDSLMQKVSYGQVYPLMKVMGVVLLTQSVGFCIAYAGIFGYPRTTFLSVLTTFGAGILANIAYIVLSVIPHVLFKMQYSSLVFQSLVYPTTHTFVSISLIGSVLSTFPAPGNAVLDFEPMKQVASLFGLAAINFLIQWIGTLMGLLLPPILEFVSDSSANNNQLHSKLHSKRTVNKVRFLLWVIGGISVLFMITSFIAQADSVYQVNVSHQLTPTISVSCIFGHDVTSDSSEWSTVWNATSARVAAGDKIILFSEETLDVNSDEEEQTAIDMAKQIAMDSGTATIDSPVLIGVCYKKTLQGNDYSTNVFTLIAATSNTESTTLWSYDKANPVPLIESDVRAGPPQLPYAASPYGKLSGAICFDLDFPNFIAQAGQHKVDILLQPSWTWNAINYRHFNGDAVRSVENGFSLFRCSSDGESGVVDPRGKVLSRQFTGHDPAVVSTFTLPIQDRVTTLFNNGGFIFQYICIICSFFYLLFAYVPKRYSIPVARSVVYSLHLQSCLWIDETDDDKSSIEDGEMESSLIVNGNRGNGLNTTNNNSSGGVYNYDATSM